MLNYEITLYNTPYFENLVSEFYRISRYKRNIYKKIQNENDYQKKLSFEERLILRDLNKKENKIILEILISKQWLNIPIETKDSIINEFNVEYNSLLEENDKYGI